MICSKEQLRRTCSKKHLLVTSRTSVSMITRVFVSLFFNFKLYIFNNILVINLAIYRFTIKIDTLKQIKHFFRSRCDILVYLSVLDQFWPVRTLSSRHKKQDDFSDISLNCAVKEKDFCCNELHFFVTMTALTSSQ